MQTAKFYHEPSAPPLVETNIVPTAVPITETITETNIVTTAVPITETITEAIVETTVEINNWVYENSVRDPLSLTVHLRSMEWPDRLISNFIKNVNQTPMRYFIIDDSSSMEADDGKIIMNREVFRTKRWFELRPTIEKIYNTSNIGLIRSKFLLLNKPGFCFVGNKFEREEGKLNRLKHHTGGGTPLCAAINKIISDITSYLPELIESRKKVSIVIFTDGQSTDGDIKEPLQRLSELPVKITLRLCTDESCIIEYWNRIDRDLSLKFDVIDDYLSEAKEVFLNNPWLCYTTQLQDLREFGAYFPLIDLLDERGLSGNQIDDFRRIIGLTDQKPYCMIRKRRVNYIEDIKCSIC